MKESFNIDEKTVELRPGSIPNTEILEYIKGKYRFLEMFIINDVEKIVDNTKINYLGTMTTLTELYDNMIMSLKAGGRLYVIYISQIPDSTTHFIGVDVYRMGREEIYKFIEDKILTLCQVPIVLSKTPYQIPIQNIIEKPVYTYEIIACNDRMIVVLSKRRRANIIIYKKRKKPPFT
ncbi:MAG: hypothetical protein QXH21_09215 [Ignisphaera sp.]